MEEKCGYRQIVPVTPQCPWGHLRSWRKMTQSISFFSSRIPLLRAAPDPSHDNRYNRRINSRIYFVPRQSTSFKYTVHRRPKMWLARPLYLVKLSKDGASSSNWGTCKADIFITIHSVSVMDSGEACGKLWVTTALPYVKHHMFLKLFSLY